jgi:hypothetical protein
MERTDPSELRENLDSNTMHQPRSPLGHREHDSPTRDGDCLLCSDGGLDFVKLAYNIFVIQAIEVQLAEHSQRFFFAISLHEMTGRFWEEHDAQSEDRAG